MLIVWDSVDCTVGSRMSMLCTVFIIEIILSLNFHADKHYTMHNNLWSLHDRNPLHDRVIIYANHIHSMYWEEGTNWISSARIEWENVFHL